MVQEGVNESPCPLQVSQELAVSGKGGGPLALDHTYEMFIRSLSFKPHSALVVVFSFFFYKLFFKGVLGS